ncbi:hypothetical protein B7L88_gp106 [Rhizobium phage RHEph10]|uniref:hypothetical protein n=1 Tax=Rhizobium phage RHEph10 TaxID=1220717 RepID=UPI0002AB3073|nr:hypothetical protein B7L88_gp106 [Rhizobium phage RHEph10]AGC36182.1 hypothetical protein RHEph10_gp139 [Rhizobium phage RHEph10]
MTIGKGDRFEFNAYPSHLISGRSGVRMIGVTVEWNDGTNIHYRRDDNPSKVEQTPIERFTEVAKPLPRSITEQIHNPFRQDLMRRQFTALIKSYETKNPDLIRPDGARHTGNSWAIHFWWGYDNSLPQRYDDRASRDTLGYAAFKAGRAVAEWEAKRQAQPPLDKIPPMR